MCYYVCFCSVSVLCCAFGLFLSCVCCVIMLFSSFAVDVWCWLLFVDFGVSVCLVRFNRCLVSCGFDVCLLGVIVCVPFVVVGV